MTWKRCELLSKLTSSNLFRLTSVHIAASSANIPKWYIVSSKDPLCDLCRCSFLQHASQLAKASLHSLLQLSISLPLLQQGPLTGIICDLRLYVPNISDTILHPLAGI
jgi:hypothetical protein